MVGQIAFAAVLAVGLPAQGNPRTFSVTTVTIQLDDKPGTISQDIYGQYLEHVQQDDQCIYPSIWNDKSPLANRMGLREDVITAVKGLNVPVVRWPGGCYADVYHWEDAIGPREKRSEKPNLHWGGMESNQFGTDEFLHWCEAAGIKPYITVNLGSGTLEEALRWLEYCNGDAQTPQGKRRAAHGRTQPYSVRYWGIGNETWGEWERGHMDAESYGRKLAQWATAMKAADPKIKILAVGSEEGNDPDWDRAVLSHAAPIIDYLTFHSYGISTQYDSNDEFEAIAFTPAYMENRLRRMLTTIDESTGTRVRNTPLPISVDEWNIRHHRDGEFTRKDPRNMQDALFVSGFLNAMIRLSPRVYMGNYVFLVNGNATLLVDEKSTVKTPLYHTFMQYGKWMQGEALRTTVDGAKRIPPPPLTAFPGKVVPADYTPVETTYVDAVAALRPNGQIAVSLINRDVDTTATITLDLPGNYAVVKSWRLLTKDSKLPDLHDANDFENPEHIVPVTTVITSNRPEWVLPPHSFALLLCSEEDSSR